MWAFGLPAPLGSLYQVAVRVLAPMVSATVGELRTTKTDSVKVRRTAITSSAA